MASGDKQQPIVTKKVALRDLSNDTLNIIMKPPGNSPPPKDNGCISDFGKVSGFKRKQPSCPSSPSHPPPAGSNGRLVYVRRKLETDAGKIIACENVDDSDSPSSRKLYDDVTREPKTQPEQAQETKVPFSPVLSPITSSMNTSSGEISLILSLGKPDTGLAVTETNQSRASNVTGVHPSTERPTNDQYWKERFLRLQVFLKDCDQSNQEEYIQRLKSLSASSRSRHAVELETRAMQLLLEEAKELNRMKQLNVLGKSLPMDNQAPVSTQASFPMQTVRGK